MFSAVTSAFIIQVNSQLQPDPNEETAALLRVLIYKIDNTTFGNDVPTIPQWSGPPRSIIQVQAILYASLATSLFSAFLAMLGKQWLNRYASIDMRGTAIERSQNRQQKLNGIVTWYFEHVMESLPLMLQAALLLLGCALSRYLWEIDTTVASVILGATSLGVVFYLFIVIAGSASASCPYQTPGSRLLRSSTLALMLAPSALASIASAIAPAFRHAFTNTIHVVQEKKHWWDSWWSRDNVIAFLKRVPYKIPGALATDCYHFIQMIFLPLVVSTCRVYIQLLAALSTPTHGSDQQSALLDIHCISWILQTSLDKDDHLSATEYLVTMVEIPGFDPALVAGCFSAFASCIKVTNGDPVVTQGLEQPATMSATCLLHTLSYLLVTDPMSSIIGDIRHQYNRVFPPETNFKDFPFYHILYTIHKLLNPGQEYLPWDGIEWWKYRLPDYEHTIVAHALTKLAKSEYKRRRHSKGKKVPRWILRFVLYSLSLDPLPSTPVMINCLLIIAIDLDCDTLGVETTILDKRYVYSQ